MVLFIKMYKKHSFTKVLKLKSLLMKNILYRVFKINKDKLNNQYSKNINKEEKLFAYFNNYYFH